MAVLGETKVQPSAIPVPLHGRGRQEIPTTHSSPFPAAQEELSKRQGWHAARKEILKHTHGHICVP